MLDLYQRDTWWEQFQTSQRDNGHQSIRHGGGLSVSRRMYILRFYGWSVRSAGQLRFKINIMRRLSVLGRSAGHLLSGLSSTGIGETSASCSGQCTSGTKSERSRAICRRAAWCLTRDGCMHYLIEPTRSLHSVIASSIRSTNNCSAHDSGCVPQSYQPGLMPPQPRDAKGQRDPYSIAEYVLLWVYIQHLGRLC
jgi:hypothetical protein